MPNPELIGEQPVIQEDNLGDLEAFLAEEAGEMVGSEQVMSVLKGLKVWRSMGVDVVKNVFQLIENSKKPGQVVETLKMLEDGGGLSWPANFIGWKALIGVLEGFLGRIDISGIENFCKNYWLGIRTQMQELGEEEIGQLALELFQRKVDANMLLDWLKSNSVVAKKDWVGFKKALIDLIEATHRSKKINLSRVLQMLEKSQMEANVANMNKVVLLLEKGIYPTPTVLTQLLERKRDNKLNYWLLVLAEKMDIITKTEQVNLEDQVDLELYYAYLNVNISFEEFTKTIKKLDQKKAAISSQQWEKVRISARGAEAITKDIDEVKVEEIKEDLLKKSDPAYAVDFLRAIPALGKTVLEKEHKKQFVTALVSTVISQQEKKQSKLNASKSPFNDANVLGKVDATLKLEPDATKLELLMYAEYALTTFIRKAEEFLKAGHKLVDAEAKAVNKNVGTAKKLMATVLEVLAQDCVTIVKKSQSNVLHLEDAAILNEYFLRLDLADKKSVSEQKAQDVLGFFLMEYGLQYLVKADLDLIKEGMRLATVALAKSALSGEESRKKLFEAVEMSYLLEADGTAGEMRQGRPEVILESADDLWRNRVDENLKGALKLERANDGDRELCLSVEAVKITYKFAVTEARETIKKSINSLRGLEAYVSKQSGSAQLKASLKKLTDNLIAKAQEVDGYYDLAPAVIREHAKRTYHMENTRNMVGILKFATGSNRSFDELLRIADLSDSDKNAINSAKARLNLHRNLLSQLQKLMEGTQRIEQDEIESLDLLQARFAKIGDQIAVYMGQIEPYHRLQLELEKVKKEWGNMKKLMKDQLYHKHLQENGGTYVPAVFYAVLNPKIKELDKSFGARIRELRGTFEKEHAELGVEVGLLEKMTEMVGKIGEGLNPLDKIRSGKMAEVEVELAKVSYANMAEDEYELVPSKTLGDGLKGWVSDDCSKDKADHIHNSCFVNYRVYKKVGQEKLWMGNIYLLDAIYKGNPVIVVDAVQTSISAAGVNYKDFMEKAIQGISEVAAKLNFKYLIANEIKSAGEGWLISNRTQLKQAYIDLYGDCETIKCSSADLSMKDNQSNEFQSFSYGNKNFKILWTHPELAMAIGFNDLVKELANSVSAATIKDLKAIYKKAPFETEVMFMTKAGLENCRKIAADSKKFDLLVNLFGQFVHNKASHAVLMDEEKLDLISRYVKIDTDSAILITKSLINRSKSAVKYFDDLTTYGERAHGSAFVMRVLVHQVFTSPELLEKLYVNFAEMEKWELGKDYINALSHKITEEEVSKNSVVAEYLKNNEIPVEDWDKVRAALREGMLENIFTTVPVGKYLEVVKLNASYEDKAHKAGQIGFRGLDTIKLALRIKLFYKENIELLEDILKSAIASENLPSKELLEAMTYNTVIKKIGDAAKLINLVNRLDGLSALHKDDKSRNFLNVSDILTLLKKSPGMIDEAVELVEKILGSEGEIITESKAVFCKQFIVKGDLLKAWIVANAPAELLEIFYFFVFHIKSEQLDRSDNLASLEAKFLQQSFDGTLLKKYAQLKNLVISGRDYLFVKPGHRTALLGYFDAVAMSKQKRVMRGEAERIEKVLKKGEDLSEEEMKKLGEIGEGYIDLDDWADDQKSIYDMEFHN